jgi:glycosyltransferase involved in cell wall biosynthesis
MIEAHCRRYPGRFRYLFESLQGKSYALNAGIRASQGDILAFMGDDVTVDTRWLQRLTVRLDNGEWEGVFSRKVSFLPPRGWQPKGPIPWQVCLPSSI